MSDFLTRLAQRQLGVIPTIVPRVKPLYASSPNGLLVPPLTGKPVSEPVVRQDSSFDARHDHEASPANPEALRPARGGSEDTSLVRPRLPLALQETVGRPILPVGDRMSQDLESNRPPSAKIEYKVSTPERMSAAPRREEVQPPAIFPRLTSESPGFPGPVPQLSDRTKIAVPTPLLNPIKEISVPRHVEAPPPPVLVSARKDRTDTLPKPVADAPVRVTIGRIEVTAITGAAPSKRSTANRKPRVTLDEYLAGHQGSRR